MRTLVLIGIVCCLIQVSFTKVCLNQATNFKKILNTLELISKKSVAVNTFSDPVVVVDNRNGRILHKIQNHVVAKLESGDDFFRNPLNHCGRQAASWYWENKKRLNLPEPKHITVITSVDNCIMCTGALLASGLNVGAVNVSPGSTTNSDGTGLFSFYQATSPALHSALTSTTGYYKVEGDVTRSAYVGPDDVAFKDDEVPASVNSYLG